MVHFEYLDPETKVCVLEVEGCRVYVWPDKNKEGELIHSVKNLDNSEGCKIPSQLLIAALETAKHLIFCKIENCPSCEYMVRPKKLRNVKALSQEPSYV